MGLSKAVELQGLLRMNKYHEGSVHGRFQPLHKGHLNYFLAAKEYCDFMWVGITQYDIHSLLESPNDPHRQERMHNPLTFFERVEMITNALSDNGLKLDEFDIVPFPIETPECLPDFLPTTVPIFTTIYDQWNRHKIEVLKERGYEIIVLWEDTTKIFDGITIRELIYVGDESWKQKVPLATIDVIEKYHIRDRLISIRDHNHNIEEVGSESTNS